jgi:hypothetical protein
MPRPRPPLGPLVATPAGGSVSVRVGDQLEFSAAAEGATGYRWVVWGRPAGGGPTWTFVPAPEDAGWQQVRVVAEGAGGAQVTRTWNVGVVPAVAPEMVEVTPPAGVLRRAAGEQLSLRCGARVKAARGSDRLRFEWRVDDRPVHREEHAAAAAVSEIDVTSLEPGTNRVSVRVSEDDRTAAVEEWTIETTPPGVASAPPPTSPPHAVPPSLAPAPPVPPPTLAAVPAVRLVAAPGERSLECRVGDPLVLGVRLEPETPAATFEWTVDGRRARRGTASRFDYNPTSPGRHRLGVRVVVDGREVGSESWTVAVAEPTPPPLAAANPPSTVPSRSAGLDDEEVRRWLDDYARAWSRKDMDALRRMGQVRSAEEAEKLERYFRSVTDIRVDVRVRALHIEGDRASVEFERVDTVTDPAGRQQELRLPPLRKEIQRTPQGLRFADHRPPG